MIRISAPAAKVLFSLAALLCLSSTAHPAAVFVLAPQEQALGSVISTGKAKWREALGRGGGTALEIVPPAEAEPMRLMLFDKPRPLASPDQYRAEAWVKTQAGTCTVRLILYDAATGAQRAAYTIVTQADARTWRYGACDLPIIKTIGGLQYNIEVSARCRSVLIDGLKLFASDSILPNGRFRQITRKGPQTPVRPLELDHLLPWGWRRLYTAKTSREQAAATYDTALAVKKGQGEFVLSSEPMRAPSNAAGMVARVRVETTDALLPTVLLRQYGEHNGLLGEDCPDWKAEPGKDANETIITTAFIRRRDDAWRIILLLRFPKKTGRCIIRSVELASLETRKTDVQIFADQVGYDSGRPMRFVVATETFPSGQDGTFVLKGANGKEYRGRLVATGRSVGENGSDWGSYYFQGAVAGAAEGSYVLTVTLGDRTASLKSINVGPRLRVSQTGELAYRFYFVQRCGFAVPGWFSRCHMDDGVLPDGTHVDVTGGYHNAGDYHKHTGDNTPISVYGMIRAYESFQGLFGAIDGDKNGRADILDEAMWGADWALKMVDPKTGRCWKSVANDMDYFGSPADETDGIIGNADDRRIVTDDPFELGGPIIASWAALARHVGKDGGKYLEAAEKLWATYEKEITAGHNPRHILAAMELYRTTGNEKYRQTADVMVKKVLETQKDGGWFVRSPQAEMETFIVDEGTRPAALARYALENPRSPLVGPIKDSLRKYFAWSFRMADNPFGIIRNYAGGEPFYFMKRGRWFVGNNSQYCSTAWAAYLAARLFADDAEFAEHLTAHADNQVHWVLGVNPLGLCMFEGRGNSSRINHHHRYADIPGHPRGAVPGAIVNGIIREPGNSDRPWFDFSKGTLPDYHSAEPWLPHNAYYLLMLSATPEANFPSPQGK